LAAIQTSCRTPEKLPGSAFLPLRQASILPQSAAEKKTMFSFAPSRSKRAIEPLLRAAIGIAMRPGHRAEPSAATREDRHVA
jgi:hypothetical protein